MEAKAIKGLQISTMVYREKLGRARPGGSLRISSGFREQKNFQVFVSAKLLSAIPATRITPRTVPWEVACSYNNVPVSSKVHPSSSPPAFSARASFRQRISFSSVSVKNKSQFPHLVSSKHEDTSFKEASTMESGSFHAPADEELILKLKSKSQEIEPFLNGRCIYLVGMMGSGKTTVGKILSQVLSYSFFDSDALVEEEVDGTSVADIFKHYGEAFFRDKETEVLRKLSIMHRHVISTGGGAVLRPINWKYMHHGISVGLDVPVEALAQRITAVGTNSRPLLHYESGDAYTRTFMRLSALFEERSEAYANANTRVSLENMTVKLCRRDVSDLSPTAIAMEALDQIKGFLKGEDGR